jgi:hypothetical protein
MILKQKRKNKDEKIIGEFKEKIKECEAELLKLEEYLKQIEIKLVKIVRQMDESRERDKDLRKKIEILVRKMQNRW